MRKEKRVDRTPRWVSITDEVDSEAFSGRTYYDQYGKPIKNQVQKKYNKKGDTITKEFDIKKDDKNMNKK